MTSGPDRKPSVFIVDDEIAIRDALCLAFQARGISVKQFSSAGEFIEFVELHDVSGPVCLITDIQMPEIDGFELLEFLNASDKEIPVVMITGHGHETLKHKAEVLGATYLEKPFRMAEIGEIVSKNLKNSVRDKNTR